MKVSDYIVSFLISKGITDVFGYPGGMVTHLMDSFDKFEGSISAHVNYHEQGASFCACSFAQVSKIPGCAYATSGPGATNLITGIANAYFDSIPCIFITGQVNTYESKALLKVRQKGFQETDIISMVDSVTKYTKNIDNADDIKYELEKAYYLSTNGRPGPVLLDIPMNIQRADIDVDLLRRFIPEIEDSKFNYSDIKATIFEQLSIAKKPLIIAGAGINSADVVSEFRKFVENSGIPVVTSMIAVDILPTASPYNFGFIGAYGHRYANFLIAHCDLIISIGSRLDCRQTGSNLDKFAENAKVLRIDIDEDETTNKLKQDEVIVLADIKELIPLLCADPNFNLKGKYSPWLSTCNELKLKLSGVDHEVGNQFVNKLSSIIEDGTVVTTDVGQNQVWVAQGFDIKEHQRILFSGGLGAMGYSLPAAIGAFYASGKNVVCFSGDGGLQMNIQELQFIARDNLPIKIILLNNRSLGMIRHFQEMYFSSNFMQTKADKGYSVPDFGKIAFAYGLDYHKVSHVSEISSLQDILNNNSPAFIEVVLSDTTYVFPKLSMGRPIHDQDPLMDRSLFDELLSLDEPKLDNVVVTGGTSFLGISLINLLLSKNHHVFCIIRPNSKNLYRLKPHKNLEIIELELSDYGKIHKHISAVCSSFYHCAWDGVRAPERDDSALQHKNYIATINAINSAKKLGCKTFTGVGSQAEYGIVNGSIDENCKSQPISEYGKSKLKTFNEGTALCDSLDMKFIWTRIFSLYGPYDYDGSLVMSCLSKMLINSPIPLTDCSQMWDFLFVEDAAKAMVALAERDCDSGAYNLASGVSKSLKSFVVDMKSFSNSLSDLNFGDIPYGPSGPIGFTPNIDKLKFAVDWLPVVNFKSGINKIIKFMDYIDYLKRDETNEKD